MKDIKVIIADDHEMVVEGLVLLLEQEEHIQVIDKAYDGVELLEKIEKTDEVDIIILDINMPKLDGIEVTKKIKDTFPEIKVLIVTTYNRKEFIRNLMECGTDGYILKNSGKEELIGAISSLSNNEPYYGSEITKTIIKDYQKTKIFDSPLDVELTDREKDIIRLIAKELSTAEIAEELCLSQHTINSHRKNILSKLEVKNAAGIVKYAIQSGIVKGFDL